MTFFLASQSNVDFKFQSTKAGDALLLQSFEAYEGLSDPFEISVTLQSNQGALALETMIGSAATIELKFPSGTRYLCGCFGQFSQSSTLLSKNSDNITYYQGKLYPQFWFLKFTKNSRIFQNMQTISIIKEVLKENGVQDLVDKTTSCGKDLREYCVQFEESCFDFVSRLMEEVGIYYYFEHTQGAHSMVLADGPSAYKPCLYVTKVPIAANHASEAFYLDQIFECDILEQAVIGKFAHTDFDYLKPTTPLTVQAMGQGDMKGVYFEYPGLYSVSAQGNTLANNRLLAAELPKSLIQGTSTVPYFSPGHAFTLMNHSRPDANTAYVIMDCHHAMDVSGRVPEDQPVYRNRFRAFAKTATYKPLRKTPRPRMPSVQTAIVSGKKGEEIWTDAYGRVKVHFHWDHAGTRDEKSSCWVRVAQTWAGNGWGTQFIPRIGQEVVVTFVNGDPDRPLITGVVYNGIFTPPYPAAQATKSTIKTSSTKGNKGFNELRFDDKAGSEEIYMHAQKDVNVDIVNNRTTLIEKGDETLTIKSGNRTEHIHKNDQLLIDQGNKVLKITKGNKETILSKGNRTTQITGNDTLKVQGNRAEEITGNYSLKVSKNMQITVGGQLTIKVTGPINIKTNTAGIVNAAANLVLKSGANVVMQGAAAFVVKGGSIGKIQSGAPLMIKGAIVKIN